MDVTTAVLAALGVVLAAVVTGLVTWAVARRAKSGKVNTTEAAKLWDEGTTMRQELRIQVSVLEKQITALTANIVTLNQAIESARNETEAARYETRQSRAETRVLMRQIDALHGEVKTNNTLTIAALADNQETRRILLVPKDERTPVEFQHLSTVNERQPEGEHPVVEESDLREGEGLSDE